MLGIYRSISLLCITGMTSLLLSSCKDTSTVQTPPLAEIAACVSATGTDGEGCANLDVEILTAGDTNSFTLTYTAGDTGVPIGGAIAFGFHHGSKWSFQTKRWDSPSYLSVTSSSKAQFDLQPGNSRKMFPGQTFSKFSSLTFNQVTIAKIKRAPVKPGDTVTFRFGANEQGLLIQSYRDPKHEIRVSTDLNGDGVFKRVEDSLFFKIKSGTATQFTATAPSQVQLGTAFPVTFRANDARYNIVEAYNEAVDIRDENGTLVLSDLKFTNGIAKADIRLDTTGPQRLRIQNKTGGITGRSNPFRVFETLPETQIFWGDIHGHTGWSDGLGRSREAYFEYGRDVAALDILALTDHGHADWDALKSVVKTYHDPGKFVTILAQEAGARQDHMNIYLRNDDAKHIRAWQTDYVKFQNTLIDQYNQTSENAQTSPHHFAYKRFAGNDLYPFGHWDERVARFVEIYSSHGTNEFPGNPRPLGNPDNDKRKYMQWGLDQGLRFGVVGASDNHDSKPGHSWWSSYPNGLGAFLVSDLARENVWQSLWNRRTYATSFDRIYMDLTLNGHPMGSDLPYEGPLRFEGEIIGKTDEVKISLLRNNEIIWGATTDTGVIPIDFEDDVPVGAHHYYLRVEQSNGERAWSSPFWVTRNE